ncbi:hypothetical protein GCM10007877_33390 [Marinibactrum halimedae]|uniref:Carboxypeptidase regulatory-like domain-containing protein n=2 Tax=Marinibactrum halimedae TaxID=1444977 RepID=A0AA37WNL7_9GAMM|nr:hypothetical protein [Marinibactrum halimedae]GLS27620.1 hypothetical protein GCM10007877_33390 [Marinibactrum halimedae]
MKTITRLFNQVDQCEENTNPSVSHLSIHSSFFSLQYFFTLIKIALIMFGLVACGGGGGGGSGASTGSTNGSANGSANGSTNDRSTAPSSSSENTNVSQAIFTSTEGTITGKATYDYVPTRRFFGLDYSAIEARPIRYATVHIVDETNTVIATGMTDEQGDFTLEVAAESDLRIQIRAEILHQGAEIKVQDNTANNGLFVLQSSSFSFNSSGTNNSSTNNPSTNNPSTNNPSTVVTKNLHAPSGWAEGGYQSTRSAAPFAILDTVYTAMESSVLSLGISSPPVMLRWSPENRPARGAVSDGEIGSSHYSTGENAIYILGAENQDTDEYDRHVVVHEFGHFLEKNIGRMDSIGGSHSLSHHLDLRVAFSEGLATALAGNLLNDPLYVDSVGPQQARASSFDIESDIYGVEGWFNESTVQRLLYDLMDANNEGADIFNFGIESIIAVLSSDDYRHQASFAGIHSFLHRFTATQPDDEIYLDQFYEGFGITVVDEWGAQESNSGNAEDAVEIYTLLELGTPQQVCTNKRQGEFNKLGNRRFFRLDTLGSGNYRISVVGDSGSNPEYRLWRQGELMMRANHASHHQEVSTHFLNEGTHVMELYDYGNIDGESSGGGDHCFTVALSHS